MNGDASEQHIAELGARYEAIRMRYFEARQDDERFIQAELAFKRWSRRANDLHFAIHRPADQKIHGKSTVSFMAKRGWMPPIPR